MKKLATVITISLAVVGCEKSQGSKLDNIKTTEDTAPAKAKKPNATPIGTGTIEERVARLEQS